MEEDIRDIVQRLKGNTDIDRDALLDALAQMAQRIVDLQMRVERLLSGDNNLS